MNILNAPHVFIYNKIEDCKLPEGRVSVPFGFSLSGGNAQIVPVPFFRGNIIQGDFYTLDLGAITNGVKGLTGIKSLELDLQFFVGGVLGQHPFAPFYVIVQDSQQFFTLIPSGLISASAAESGEGIIHVILPIISNAPTKIWFILDGTLGSGTGAVFVSGVASNFERKPYVINSLS